MKNTSALTLLLLGVGGIAVGTFVQLALAQSGQPVLKPPVTLGIVLAAIGVIVVVLAWPIRRSTRGSAAHRVDPFHATRVLVLAKSSALSGALLGGVGIALVVHILTRPVPAVGSIGVSLVTLVGALVLMVCGLVAEQLCKLPPDDSEDTIEKSPAKA